MRRAIELAKKGIGAVNPNPLVGAVIVKNGRIIGEGYHRRYGELHAERDAFAHLTEDAAGAEMYVTLEPCCHYGKQPPCVNAIIEHKISRVYVGSDDPNALVSGKGYQILRDAGIEVITHVLKEIGFGICLVSNNKEPRVAEFNKPLDVKYIYKAGKPKRTGYQKAMQLLGTDTANTLFVGDQLFTDLWGANNTGITSLLVMPIDKKEEIQIVLKRIPEKWILHSYLKKHQIVR